MQHARDIDSGAIEGASENGVIAFKGIPLAQPPVGALRWQPPQPPSWPGVRKADSYGADCMQVPFPSDAAPLGVKPAEDCLYVNVWLPAKAPTGEAAGVCVDLRRWVRQRWQLTHGV